MSIGPMSNCPGDSFVGASGGFGGPGTVIDGSPLLLQVIKKAPPGKTAARTNQNGVVVACKGEEKRTGLRKT